MSIRQRLIGVLALLLLLCVAAMTAIQHCIIMPSFLTLQRQDALGDMKRCIDAIDHDAESLAHTASDYAQWDDAAEFVFSDGPERGSSFTIRLP